LFGNLNGSIKIFFDLMACEDAEQSVKIIHKLHKPLASALHGQHQHRLLMQPAFLRSSFPLLLLLSSKPQDFSL
jgi:hypothetical protein